MQHLGRNSDPISPFRQDERGISASGYGLIVALIAIVCVEALKTVGTQLSATLVSIADSLYNHTADTEKAITDKPTAAAHRPCGRFRLELSLRRRWLLRTRPE
jgi:Flp pilus assembly pilin Flp